jgi:hypothetical protein
VGDAGPEGLAGEPERLIDPVAVAPGRAVLPGGGRDFEHDDGALLGGGLGGRQGLGERGQRVAGAGEPDRDQRPVRRPRASAEPADRLAGFANLPLFHTASYSNTYSNTYSCRRWNALGAVNAQDTAEINLPVDSQTYIRAQLVKQ